MADLDTFKQALPIESVVGEYVSLRKAGTAYKGLCPFHPEKTPSFTVNPERGSFRCFGCGKGGDVVTFLMEIEKVDFKEAVRRLARKAGIEINLDKPEAVDPELDDLRSLHEAAALFFQAALASAAGEPARRYLEGRHLSRQTIDRFGLGWAPAGWDHLLRHLGARGHSPEALERAGLVVRNAESGGRYDRFRNRLIFPIRDAKGRLTGFGGRELDGSQPKYLNSPQTKLFDKGNVLYLLDAAQETARKQASIVVVEGYTDALMAHQSGFGNVVASLGTALTDRQLRQLQRTARKITIALDADAAGQRAVEQTIQLAYQVFERQRVPRLSGRPASERAPGGYTAQMDVALHVAALPAGQDPDEVIHAAPERWQQLMADAAPIVQFLFERVLAVTDSDERLERANRQLLPVIAQIPDPLERGHYVDRVATALGVPEAAIASAIGDHARGAYSNDRAWRQRAGPAVRSEMQRSAPESEGADAPLPELDDGAPTEEASTQARRRSPALLFSAERGRQRYLLSMLMRYPRQIAAYADRLAGLRPDDIGLSAAWEHVLSRSNALALEDFTAALPEDGPLTEGYLTALLRETATLPPLDETRLRVALDDALVLLQGEQLRQRIARCQARLREATDEERPAIVAELAALARERAAMDYNRERPA